MRILIVEDDRLLNSTLVFSLSSFGYMIDSAMTKLEAQNLCRKYDYDLIVFEIDLTDGNGFDFCTEIKE